MEHDFYDQVILVTGGTGALGSKVAELFLKFSPKAIIISYRSEKEMQELKPKILEKNSGEGKENHHTLIEFAKADSTNEDGVKTIKSIIMKKLGQVHVLADVVGGYIRGKSVSEPDQEEWDKLMLKHLSAPILKSNPVLAHMSKKKVGMI